MHCFLAVPHILFRQLRMLLSTSPLNGFHNLETTPFQNLPESFHHTVRLIIENIERIRGSIVGYKYLNMNAVPQDKPLQMQLRLKAEDTDGRIRIMLGSPWTTKGGVEIGLVDVKAGSTCREFYAPLSIPAKLHKGKQPLFFVFESETEGQSICEFYDFLMLARP